MNVIINISDLPSNYDIAELDILASGYSTFYDSLLADDSVVDFYFTQDIDDVDFSNLIKTSIPGDKVLRIASFDSNFDLYDPPIDFDFGLLDLEKKKNLQVGDHGDIPIIEYYKSYDPITNTYSDLVTSRNYTFQYNTSPRLYIVVDEVVKWFREDGTVHPLTKTIKRTYTEQRWTTWLVNKRTQIVEFLKHWVMTSMFATAPNGGLPTDSSAIMATGASWFSGIDSLINSYKETYAVTELINALNADTTAWLDNVPPTGLVPGLPAGKTIRELMTDEVLY